MKKLRLVFASLAIVAAAAWAIAAIACDKKSTTAAAASNGACTPMTSAECKARMAAGETCPMHGTQGASATTAAMEGCTAHGAKATTAAMEGCAAHGAKTTTAAAGQCPYSGAKATTASTTTAAAAGDCAAHGAKTAAAGTDACCAGKGATSATTAAATKSGSSCSMHGATTTAAAGSSCGTQGAKSTSAGHGCPDHNVSAMAAGLGSNCDGHEKSGAAAHLDCDACDDLSTCDAELQAAGATMQTVPIKNGVMFVYTAKAPGGVNAIQSVMSRRTEHLSRIVSSGSKARLCDDCKSMRGAMASGRLVREVVNIEGGALVLVTSVDPTLVKRIRDLADASKMAVKS